MRQALQLSFPMLPELATPTPATIAPSTILNLIQSAAAVYRLPSNQQPSRRSWDQDLPFLRLDPACLIVRLLNP
jgi:hypothetical protein